MINTLRTTAAGEQMEIIKTTSIYDVIARALTCFDINVRVQDECCSTINSNKIYYEDY